MAARTPPPLHTYQAASYHRRQVYRKTTKSRGGHRYKGRDMGHGI